MKKFIQFSLFMFIVISFSTLCKASYEYILPTEYSSISISEKFIFAKSTDGLVSIFDLNGNLIEKTEYQNITSYKNYTIATKNNSVFILDENCVYQNVSLPLSNYTLMYSDSYVSAFYFDEQNDEISLNIYNNKGEKIGPLPYDFTAQSDLPPRVKYDMYTDGKNIFDISGNKLTNASYSEISILNSNFFSAKVNGVYDIFKISDEVSLNLAMESIIACGDPKSNFADILYYLYKKDNLWGILSNTFEIVMKPFYSTLHSFPNFNVYYNENCISYYYNNSLNLISFDGTSLLPENNNYTVESDFEDGLLKICDNYKYGFCNNKGEFIIPVKYNFAGDFSEGFCYLAKTRNLKQHNYLVNTYGNIVYESDFLTNGTFKNGLFPIYSYAEPYYFINIDGTKIMPNENDIWKSVSNLSKNYYIVSPELTSGMPHPQSISTLGLIKYTQDAIPDFKKTITRLDFCSFAAELLAKHADINTEDILKTLRSFSEQFNFPIKKSEFTDCNSEYVKILHFLGIINGRSEQIFDPDGLITREEAAKILKNIAALFTDTSVKGELAFSDLSDISGWAQDSVIWCNDSKIMMGTGNTMFSPKSFYTREQAMITMNRLYNLFNQK